MGSTFRLAVAAVLATVVAVSGLVTLAPRPAHAAGERLKAVIIIGPTGSLTSSNLADGEAMARSAEAQGMDVRRVFHPRATWERVLQHIQGANLVVYMGHGNGWPSPYGPFQEKTKNGFGLNPYDGGSAANHTYYGGNPIRNNIRLAPNAVVLLVHLCYASGNAEPGMAIPSEDVARQRVDNFAAAFLAVGARAVFSFGWNQRLDFVKALATTDKTMDELFMTPATSGINGFVGWRNKRFASVRTPGATNHLDPHTSHGYYRAVSGDLGMRASAFRGAAAAVPSDPPAITSLEASGPTSPTGLVGLSSTGATFHPNGDGLADELLLRHSVTRATYLDVAVTNTSTNGVVRRFTVWSEAGQGASRWDGRNGSGAFVPDGVYRLTYTPRDLAGLTGQAASTQATVLRSVAVAAPSRAAIFSRDGDTLARTTTLKVSVNQPARVGWTIRDAGGNVVRTVRNPSAASTGTLSFTWDGRSDAGAFVPDGTYRSVVTSQTDLGSYGHERAIYVGAFKLTSSVASPARGARVKFVVVSTEALASRPKLRITQPGLTPYWVTMNHVSGRRYQITVTLKTGGTAGSMQLLVRGTDSGGRVQDTVVSQTIR